MNRSKTGGKAPGARNALLPSIRSILKYLCNILLESHRLTQSEVANFGALRLVRGIKPPAFLPWQRMHEGFWYILSLGLHRN